MTNKASKLWRTGVDSNSRFFCGYDGSLLKISFIFLEYFYTNRPLTTSGMSYQTNNSTVWFFMNNCQFTKIFIKGYQNSLLLISYVQNGCITGVLSQIACPFSIMAGCFQCFFCAAPYAAIQQNLHTSSSARGNSMRSCATSLWANAKQALISLYSSQSYPSRMVSGESPAASMSNICSTAKRWPLIMGLPPNILGFTVIRFNNFCSFIMAGSLIRHQTMDYTIKIQYEY